jgi:hypothetical protein
VRSASRTGSYLLAPLDSEVAVVEGGAWLWAFDDDGVYVSDEPDPIYERLAAQLTHRRPRQIHLQCFGDFARLRTILARHHALDALSHLILSSEEAGGKPPPALRALTGSTARLADWLSGPMPWLEALTLTSGVLPDLDALRSETALRHLGLWHAPPKAVVELLDHQLVEQLETLDLFDINTAQHFPFDALLVRRDRLGHLRRIHLPSHLISLERQHDFADWPAVRFLSHDRIEVLGYDLWTIAYPSALR